MIKVKLLQPRNIIFLAILPLLMIGAYIYRFGLNLPFWDQWGVVQLVMEQHEGMLTFSGLISQANEHRPLFPRLIWLTLATFTNYNVKAELWVNFGIAIGTFVFFVRQSIKKWNQREIKWSPFMIPLLSLLVFNFGQYETWLQGVQTLMLLEMTCVIIGFFTLAEEQSWRGFAISIALGIVATFSMANGLLYWLVGVCIILFFKRDRTRKIKIFTWLAAGLICTVIFLTGWSSKRLDFAYILDHIPRYIIFVINFIGSPINPSPRFAWIFGCTGVILFIFLLGYFAKRNDWMTYLPYWGLIMFILLATASISAGRLNLGLEQARVSRYHTMSIWYWASLLVLLPTIKIRAVYKTVFCLALTLALSNLMYTGYLNGQIGIYQRILPAYEIIKAGDMPDDNTLLLIYPNLDTLRPRLEFLSEQRLSAFSELPK